VAGGFERFRELPENDLGGTLSRGLAFFQSLMSFVTNRYRPEGHTQKIHEPIAGSNPDWGPAGNRKLGIGVKSGFERE
jgi:hypothetical protein